MSVQVEEVADIAVNRPLEESVAVFEIDSVSFVAFIGLVAHANFDKVEQNRYSWRSMFITIQNSHLEDDPIDEGSQWTGGRHFEDDRILTKTKRSDY